MVGTTTKASGAKVSPGQPANAPGHRAGGKREGAGRPPGSTALNEAETKRYEHWLKWWKARDTTTVKAAALARQMEEAERTVRAYAAGTRTPGPVALANLESLTAQYGYVPLTVDYLIL